MDALAIVFERPESAHPRASWRWLTPTADDVVVEIAMDRNQQAARSDLLWTGSACPRFRAWDIRSCRDMSPWVALSNAVRTSGRDGW